MKVKKKNPMVLGWREWVSLPNLNIDKIKAKVDTGAQTSSIQAFDIKIMEDINPKIVNFKVHPNQRDSKTTIKVSAELIKTKKVKSSTGHVERRPVIKTKLKVGNKSLRVELTLAKRETMGFRMLIGRNALRGKFIVDPARSYLSNNMQKKENEGKT